MSIATDSEAIGSREDPDPPEVQGCKQEFKYKEAVVELANKEEDDRKGEATEAGEEEPTSVELLEEKLDGVGGAYAATEAHTRWYVCSLWCKPKQMQWDHEPSSQNVEYDPVHVSKHATMSVVPVSMTESCRIVSGEEAIEHMSGIAILCHCSPEKCLGGFGTRGEMQL